MIRWPFTNLHTLQLDWIIAKMKELEEKVRSYATNVSASATTGAPGSQAAASVTGNLDEGLNFSFTIPQGTPGEIQNLHSTYISLNPDYVAPTPNEVTVNAGSSVLYSLDITSASPTLSSFIGVAGFSFRSTDTESLSYVPLCITRQTLSRRTVQDAQHIYLNVELTNPTSNTITFADDQSNILITTIY